MGAARPGAGGSGTAGEGVRAHPSTCPTMRGHVAYPSLAILICAMGMVTLLAAEKGARLDEKGRSWWKEPGWIVMVGKSPDKEGRDCWVESCVGRTRRGGASR